jgi:hypothetical protein
MREGDVWLCACRAGVQHRGYPQAETKAETASLRLDCLDPNSFRYTIRAKELTAA